MTFDPTEHFMKLKGKDYLPVAWRLVWFREDHPDLGIQTLLVDFDDDRAVVRATVMTPDGAVLATGHKVEHRQHFGDYVEKAETGAIGRALAAFGYGTQFAELEEDDRLADAPVDRPRVPIKDQAPEHDLFRCSTCNGPILAQDGKPINRQQADIITERFGGLTCREHRTKVAA